MDYQTILNSEFAEPAALIALNEGGARFVDINDRFLNEMQMNIAKEEFLKNDFSANFDEENLKNFLYVLKRCAETKEEKTTENWWMLVSDCCGMNRVFLKSRLVPVGEKDGEAMIFAGIRNISDEKKMKESFTDIEYRYKMSLEQINIYNWEYTIATKEMRPCYRCMRDLGLPALVENYPEPAIEAGIFPADYADMYRAMMKRIDEGSPEEEADIPLTVGRVPFRVKYTTEFDKDGKPVKAFGSATLISETELGNIRLDNQIIGTLAEEYRCIYLADFIKDEVKVIKQEELMSIPDHECCRGLLQAAASRIQDIKEEERARFDDPELFRTEMFRDGDKREFLYRDDEGNRWIRMELRVLERGRNKVDRMLLSAMILDDLQAQKMDADRLIAAQKKELEDRQSLLLDAIDEANNANKAKTEFFSSMSHDIRTPMSAITGFSRLAMEELDNRELLKDYLEKITDAGDHLMNLINDILDMSRIESGKMDLVNSPVKVRDLLTGCADMIRGKMEENKLDFHIDVEEAGDRIVECDKLRFSQIVLNLLSNACKFTPEGGSVFLTGKVAEEKKDELVYEIRVKDTGIGMSEEFSRHIWEAYSRENTDLVRETQGTGLGMMIVWNIVNMMHGTVDLHTEPGKGSEFTVLLPLKTADENRPAAFEDERIKKALERNYEGITVLVVDDTANNLRLANAILRKYGFTVRVANNGVKAVDMIKASKPGEIDLILMDVMMPVMDGFEATGRIRALPDPVLSSIPIVAMTANAFASDVQAALDAGMNAHVAKPFAQEDLIAVIDENLPE
ncbi:MAG: response regulator [Lachnospiraceae bacterium]|nr:response regulator [Lachnospiraceae bacterium]